VGDEIAHDEPLYEVSTDKVDSEVPSPVAGFLTEILVEEGATVDVGTKLAVVSDQAGPSAASPAEGDGAASDKAEAAPPATAVEPEAPPEAVAPVAAPAVGEPEAAPAVAEPEAAPAVAEPEAAPGAAGEVAGLVLSPVVRRLLTDNGLDPKAITGTGAGGRITRADVLSHMDRAASGQAPTAAGATGSTVAVGGAAAAATATPEGRSRAATSTYAPAPGERDEVVPFTNIRRVTAEHMVRSKATSAHTLVVVETDYEAVERVRRANRERFKEEEGLSLTYLPFIARAVVDVLRDYPHLNSSVGDDALIVHRDVHLGIAVDLDQRGLIVPIVRNADGQSLRGLARAMADLAQRARTRKLSADDVVGGTFTITNPGPYGTLLTAPIINQPQVAILSTDGVRRKPVVVTTPEGSEAIAIHSVGMLALSFDHRAVDGAYASAFLRDVSALLESRDWSAEL